MCGTHITSIAASAQSTFTAFIGPRLGCALFECGFRLTVATSAGSRERQMMLFTVSARCPVQQADRGMACPRQPPRWMRTLPVARGGIGRRRSVVTMLILVTSASGINGNGYGALLAFK